MWILKGRNDELFRGMWVRAMDEMLDRLVGYAESDQLQYVGDIQGYVRPALAARLHRVDDARHNNMQGERYARWFWFAVAAHLLTSHDTRHSHRQG